MATNALVNSEDTRLHETHLDESPSIVDLNSETRANGSALAEEVADDDSPSSSFVTTTTINVFVIGEPYAEFHQPAARQTRSHRRHAGLSIMRRVASWIERVRQRHALAELDDHLLRDIGLTRFEAVRESRKRFWK